MSIRIASAGVLAALTMTAFPAAAGGYYYQTVWAAPQHPAVYSGEGTQLATLLLDIGGGLSAADGAVINRLHDESTAWRPIRCHDYDCMGPIMFEPYVVPNYDVTVSVRTDDVRGSMHAGVSAPVLFGATDEFGGVINPSVGAPESAGIARSIAGLAGRLSVVGEGSTAVALTARLQVQVTMDRAVENPAHPLNSFADLVADGFFYAGVDLYREGEPNLEGWDGWGWVIAEAAPSGWSSETAPDVRGNSLDVLSLQCDETRCELSAVVEETMYVTPGEWISLNANMETHVRSSWNAVDATNSAYLSFVVPEGYALSGEGGFLADVPVTSVPEPASWGLLVSGLGLIAAAARRRLAA